MSTKHAQFPTTVRNKANSNRNSNSIPCIEGEKHHEQQQYRNSTNKNNKHNNTSSDSNTDSNSNSNRKISINIRQYLMNLRREKNSLSHNSIATISPATKAT